MESRLKDLLVKGVEQIEAQLNSETIIGRLSVLFDEITLFNPVYKLVACDGEELVTRHILDCLAPYAIMKDYIKEGSVIADLGSGSGLPGLVLASVFNNEFHLVERMGRRAGFLQNTRALMSLTDRVSVVEKDLSEVAGRFDVVVFRAFRQMKDIASDLDRITKPGSTVMIYKSSEENIMEDLKYVNPSVFSIVVKTYSVPFLNAERSLLILEKNRSAD